MCMQTSRFCVYMCFEKYFTMELGRRERQTLSGWRDFLER